MRLIASLLAFSCLLLARGASAQAFDVQQFKPAPNQQDNYFTLHSVHVLEPGSVQVGLVLNYANDSLVVVDSSGDRVGSLVGDQLAADLLFAVGVFEGFELGLDLPFTLLQDGDAIPAATAIDASDAGFGLGDVHLTAKYAIYNGDTDEDPGGPGIALLVDAQLPTGDQDNFQGEKLRLEPRLVLDYAWANSLQLSVQAGYLVRPEAELLGTDIDDALTLGAGADLPLDAESRWHLLAEIAADVSVRADDLSADEVPMEVLFGGRYHDASGVMVQAGGGFGMNVGFGTPDYRLIFGVTYGTPHDPDPDHDGLLGNDDACPQEPEDKDDFEDDNGCPDYDNDQDGVLDVADKCPLVPEDKDGFADQDGCDDPDNDNDGLLDAKDQCPDQPEDADGFEDENGCPDADNDSDGLLDGADACPNEAEDKDGFEDDNGCPDPDNDKDGLTDAKDQCPDEPEDFDGFEDDNGCPEAGSGLVKLTCEKIDIVEKVYFDSGADTIQARSFELLEQVAGVLKSATYIQRVRVEGHTDDRGKDAYNMELSSRRAASVVRFLEERGVTGDRLESQGFGESTPIATNKNEAGRGQNRRVEFMITAQDSNCGAGGAGGATP